MSIEVTVNLKGPLKKHSRGKERFAVKLNRGSTVADLIKALNLPDRSTGMVAVNGKKEVTRTTLTDSDQVVLYPPVSGG